MPSPLPRALLLPALLALAGACRDDPPGLEPPVLETPEPVIASLRLTVDHPAGTATYTMSAAGAAPSPVQLFFGISTLRVVPLGVDGQPLVLGGGFELRLPNLPAGVLFTPNGTLSAPISVLPIRPQNGVLLTIQHTTRGHSDFDATFPLLVLAAPP
jgi:hypothetical protein